MKSSGWFLKFQLCQYELVERGIVLRSQLNWILVRQAILWVGLLLCGYALWRVRTSAGDAISQVQISGWLLIGGCLTLSWMFAVMAWRHYLWAYADQDPGWRVSMRQVGLILVGKYLPGGVFGFLARLYDQPLAPRRQLFWAGLVEQVVGVGILGALGGVLLISGLLGTGWLILAFLLPPFAIVGVAGLHFLASSLPWVRERIGSTPFPSSRTLLPAVVLQLLQQGVWVALIVVLGGELFSLSGFAVWGVAGAFLLAVGLGMLVVFIPGGIGVREAVFMVLASCWIEVHQAILLAAMLRLLAVCLDAGSGAISLLSCRSRGRV